MQRHDPTPAVSREILSLLSGLRWRIRAYVFVEGMALAVIWLGLTFWAGLAIDYLPVLLGASEMPRWARAVLLVAIGGVLALILYRWVLRRALVPLARRSMAVLLERRFPQFQDSLLTSVELRERSTPLDEFNPVMLAHTDLDALSHLADVKLRRVFNFLPVIRRVLLATGIVASVVLFSVTGSEAFAVWTNRLYLLSDEPWPRHTHIEVLGFANRRLKLARGSSYTVRVRADAKRETPEVCTIYYRSDQGDRGRVHMTKEGGTADGYQHYVFSGKPFKDMLAAVRFDVVGYDHRLRDYLVEVVDSPSVIDVQLDCEMPAYTGLLPTTETWRPGLRLPRGTRITLHARTNKDLREVSLHDPESGETKTFTVGQDGMPSVRQFQHQIDSLDRDLVLEVLLADTDGVVSQRPQRFTVDMIEDEAPSVDVRVRGIGTAITPDARVPISGKISDDYGIDRAWIDLEIQDGHSRQFPCDVGVGGNVDGQLDLRAQRSDEKNALELSPGGKIVLTVKAQDKYNLEGQANVGSADRYDLDVVSPSELLAKLEAREVGLRQRFEQIISEMRETRDSVARVGESEPASGPRESGAEPEDAPSAADGSRRETDSAAETVESAADDRAGSLRRLRVQRARQHGGRASQEVLGVAASFDDIREEIINNRIDSQERSERLENQISRPLKEIANTMFPQWESQLGDLEGMLDTAEAGHAVDVAVEQADRILAEMEAVLSKMIELQDYNQLVDMVRSLIRQQQELMERTKKERAKQLLLR